jgi:hypothetical protein
MILENRALKRVGSAVRSLDHTSHSDVNVPLSSGERFSRRNTNRRGYVGRALSREGFPCSVAGEGDSVPSRFGFSLLDLYMCRVSRFFWWHSFLTRKGGLEAGGTHADREMS